MADRKKPHFEVHPSVVYQLGESLISDEIQALIELVKNCYDADATYAKVTIDTTGSVEVPGAFYPTSNGRIIIEDDGCGMGIEDIERGWLMISTRNKLDQKKRRETTKRGRTPLGDKGLGRLGVQRLGDSLEVFTKREEDTEGHHFGFSWLDFATAPTVQSVDIKLEREGFPRRKGTKVVVSDLRGLDVWKGSAVKRLEEELSQMISPYKQIRDFVVVVEVDGRSLDLLEVSDKVRRLAPIRYNIGFDGELLAIKGLVRLDFFRPQSKEEIEEFARIVEGDDGDAFFSFLQGQGGQGTSIGLSRSKSDKWFLEIHWQRKLGDLGGVQRDSDGEIANPGPFVGEVDSFDLGQAAFRQQNAFDKITLYREHIKKLSGIRVFRDGFAIRVDKDWLDLGGRWTSGTSYYGMKPDNTLGYIAISARDNMALEEMTDREGFKETPYYRNFYLLLSEFQRFTEVSHTFFGRSWTAFRKKRNEDLAQVDRRRTIEDIARSISQGLANAKSYQKGVESLKERLTASASQAHVAVVRLRSGKEITPQFLEELSTTLSNLEASIEEANAQSKKLSAFLSEISALSGLGQVLDDRVDGLRRQMDDMYETVALGLTAEALSHEVANVADHLAMRAKTLQTQVRNKKVSDLGILTFVEYTHSAVMTLRKQISFLSPALRYVREQRHEIDVPTFLAELAGVYKDRLAEDRVAVEVKVEAKVPFEIKMNSGKMTQVIDNFVMNSRYWLNEDIAQKRLTHGTITFEVVRPFVRIFDNGRGVDPAVEHALFEPFISAKERGKGRGLGLYIVKQLLGSEECSVGLLPERNMHSRLFKFQIDLRGAIRE